MINLINCDAGPLSEQNHGTDRRTHGDLLQRVENFESVSINVRSTNAWDSKVFSRTSAIKVLKVIRSYHNKLRRLTCYCQTQSRSSDRFRLPKILRPLRPKQLGRTSLPPLISTDPFHLGDVGVTECCGGGLSACAFPSSYRLRFRFISPPSSLGNRTKYVALAYCGKP